MVTIDRERLISEKQNNKASAEGARLPKETMLLTDIFKFTKTSLDAFRPFGLMSRAFQGPRGPPNSINVDFYKINYIYIYINFSHQYVDVFQETR